MSQIASCHPHTRTVVQPLAYRSAGMAATALLFLVAAASAQQPYRVPRLTGPVVMDGRSDESAWLALDPLPALSSFPTYGASPSERTEFRLAYDDEYLYVAGRLYDSDPGGIRATTLKRDEGSFTNDWFAINLDTFLDRENTIVIGINPAGARSDASFSNDAAGPPNFNWNSFWDASTVSDEGGWYAEIRIPLSSLRFEVVDGSVTLGVTIWRRIARKNEMISWPGIEHRWGTNSIFKASQTTPVVLEGVERRNPVYVTPYLLAGPSRTQRLNAARTAYDATDDWTLESGLDVKYSPTSNFTLDVTVNTDFAQVEADDQQVNLTRFPLFFPEKRVFFQERAAIFDFTLGGSDRLFHSRRIGLVEGEPVRIYGGLRAIGRAGEWDVGLLDMQTAEAGDTPSENAGVLRLRRRVLNDNSYLGGMLTGRLSAGGGHSLVAGGDALLRARGQDYLSFALATSGSDADTLEAEERLFGLVRWERRGVYGALFDVEVAHVGAGFKPDLGFIARRGHARASARTAYGWRMPAGSRLLRQMLSLNALGYRRYQDGALESVQLVPEWTTETTRGHVLTLNALLCHEDLVLPFPIASGMSVPPGVHRFGTGRFTFTPGSTSLLRVTTNLEGGTFYDGTLASLSLTPTWNHSRYLQLSGTFQVNRLNFDERNQSLTTRIARLRAQVMVNSAVSGIAFVQYNSAADAAVVNVRLRWNPREGNDLYFVYNHGLNANRFGYTPVRPLSDNQTLLIKYSFTASLAR